MDKLTDELNTKILEYCEGFGEFERSFMKSIEAELEEHKNLFSIPEEERSPCQKQRIKETYKFISNYQNKLNQFIDRYDEITSELINLRVDSNKVFRMKDPRNYMLRYKL